MVGTLEQNKQKLYNRRSLLESFLIDIKELYFRYLSKKRKKRP